MEVKLIKLDKDKYTLIYKEGDKESNSVYVSDYIATS